jgi:hypothetical protein
LLEADLNVRWDSWLTAHDDILTKFTSRGADIVGLNATEEKLRLQKNMKKRFKPLSAVMGDAYASYKETFIRQFYRIFKLESDKLLKTHSKSVAIEDDFDLDGQLEEAKAIAQ